MSERTTLIFDDEIIAMVRQLSKGNISKFVNQCLKEHLFEERKESMAGFLKGKGLLKELKKMRGEEAKVHEDLYR
ncbi:MAG: hypothetical protein PHS02_01875 [Candidatus ainarchaeum sp.]|nr:hypothetical protein [Candidatus ainarchaeum sp.]